MKTGVELTEGQKTKRHFIVFACGLSALSLIDLYGYSISKELGFSHGLLFLFSITTIISLTYISNKYISPKAAIRTSIILGFFESAIGQMWLVESSKGELNDPWPPAYLFAIIFYTTLFYGVARLINYIQNKTDNGKPNN